MSTLSPSTMWDMRLPADATRSLYIDCLGRVSKYCKQIPDINRFNPEIYLIDTMSDLMAHILHYNLCSVQHYRTLRQYCAQGIGMSESIYALLIYALRDWKQGNIEALCMICWFCCNHGVMLEFKKTLEEFRNRFHSEEHSLPDWVMIIPEYVTLESREEGAIIYTEENSHGYPLDFLNLYKDERDLTKILDGVFAVLPPGPRMLFERAYNKLS